MGKTSLRLGFMNSENLFSPGIVSTVLNILQNNTRKKLNGLERG